MDENLADTIKKFKRHLHQPLVDSQFAHKFLRCDSPSPRSLSPPSVNNDELPYVGNVQFLSSALRGYLKCYRLVPKATNDPAVFLNACLGFIAEIINAELAYSTGLKLWLCLTIRFHRSTNLDETILAYFGSCQIIVKRSQDFIIDTCFPDILRSVETFEQNGSNWILDGIEHLDMHLARYTPLRASLSVKLPQYLAKKRAILNIENGDEKCFLWCILAALYPQQIHGERVQHYRPYEGRLNFSGIKFPVSLSEIPRFENLNKIGVSVYAYDQFLYPLYISPVCELNHVNLLLYRNHYFLIRSLDRLLADQRSHHSKKFFCHRCLMPMYDENRLRDHISQCKMMEPAKVQMPQNSVLKINNYAKALKQPIVVYADFECITEKIESCSPNSTTTYTTYYQLHTPCGMGMVSSFACCGSPTFSEPIIYRGHDCVEQFLQKIISIAEEYVSTTGSPKLIRMTNSEQAQFNSASICHICQKLLNNDKVRDHCHLCGMFRGAAHSVCNQAFRLGIDIVVVFHNLRRYDGHIIMQKLGLMCKKYSVKLDCIAKGIEDYVTFTLKKGKQWRLKFIDSCQFLLCSLENLVAAMSKNLFYATQKYIVSKNLDLALRKGVYPYSYMDSWQKFNETQLPHLSSFYNDFTGENISPVDYNHAKNIWSEFNIQNLGQYHDLYLKIDVLLLADVFENFRRISLQHYGLDPCHYCTLPSYAWDACLKKTDVELELLTDPDMYMFCEKGIRGGISMISHRYAKANNQYVNNYDNSQETSYILYLDLNNLYGWAMLQPLPVSGFSWLTPSELSMDWLTIQSTGNYGYILEVDLHYPATLHYQHNDYPLAAEKLTICNEMLSDYCKSLNNNRKPTSKLVPNLFDKKHYVLHLTNLQLYLSLGLQLTKVHRGLRFTQRAWMKSYIEFNTNQRKSAMNNFEKDLFKLYNNAVFGKTMENVRAYQNVELVTNPERFRKLVANPRYERCCRFTEDLVAVSIRKPSTLHNKPIYVGMSVLDLSKCLMYKFHYLHIVPKYGSNARLLFTDTDSLCYWIKTRDIYDDMMNSLDYFDTSDYTKDHRLFSLSNLKVPGKMKDETAGKPVSEFVGLRSKMYSFVCGGVEKKRAKGVKKNVVRLSISHEDYVDALFNEHVWRHKMNMIRSKNHQLFSVVQNKITLSPYDDKRFILEDGISSYAYGHWAIQLIKRDSLPA